MCAVQPMWASRNITLTPAMAELDDVFAAVKFLYTAGHGTPEADGIVAVDHRISRQDASLNMHWHERRNDRPDPAASKFLLPANARFGASSVVVVKLA